MLFKIQKLSFKISDSLETVPKQGTFRNQELGIRNQELGLINDKINTKNKWKYNRFENLGTFSEKEYTKKEPFFQKVPMRDHFPKQVPSFRHCIAQGTLIFTTHTDEQYVQQRYHTET